MPPRPYVDDLSQVPPGSRLIRRISPKFAERSDDGTTYIKSQAVQLLNAEQALAFDCPGPGMSVILEAISSLDDLIERYHVQAGGGLSIVLADTVRSCGGLGIDFRPTGEEPAHAVVFRLDGGKNMPGGCKRKLHEQVNANVLEYPVLSVT